MLLPLDRYLNEDEVHQCVYDAVWPGIAGKEPTEETILRAQKLADRALSDLHRGGFTRERVRMFVSMKMIDGKPFLSIEDYRLSS